jgi:hypothetical protein
MFLIKNDMKLRERINGDTTRVIWWGHLPSKKEK